MEGKRTMVSKDGIHRARVLRLLRGEFNLDDVTRLFLYARNPMRAQGRQSVIDIGDFVAHPEMRDKGIMTTGARHFIDIIRFQIARLSRNAEFPLDDLPATLGPFIEAMSHRLDRVLLRRHTGLGVTAARKLAQGIQNKWIINSQGGYDLSRNLSPVELSLIQCYCNHAVPVTAFTGNRLFDDFVAILRNTLVLQKGEEKHFQDLRVAIILYAIACMHLCEIVTVSGSGVLNASVYLDRTLKVYFAFETPAPHGLPVRIATALLSTDLIASQHCEADLPSVAGAQWPFPIELSAAKRLQRLG